MKKTLQKSVIGLMALIGAGIAPVIWGQEATMGPNTTVWRLNLDKSIHQTPAPKSDRRISQVMGDNFLLSIRGVGEDGNSFALVYNGKIDGKDYPVKGTPNVDMFSLTRSGPKSVAAVLKKNGKAVAEADSAISADNRSWIFAIRLIDDKGRKSPISVEVYDRIDPAEGMWVLNLAKSNYQTPAPKAETRHFRVVDDLFDVVAIGANAAGLPYRQTWKLRLDGQDYPVQGEPTIDTLASTSSGSGAVSTVGKKNGQVVIRAERTISADGMTMRLVSNLTLPDGSTARNVAVYELQQ